MNQCIVYDMRIHTNVLTENDVRIAAREAGVSFTRFGEGKSRSHKRFFDVILTGASRRHQNGGPDKAATWDQWGYFLALLFVDDSDMVCGTVKRPVYRDAGDFNFKTDERFMDSYCLYAYWPEDAHGDHTFRYSGTPYMQTCTKCTAVTRWQ